jgi:clan AA aspartic protease (TIGR02281 family)
MMRRETRFVTQDNLIVVIARITGPRRTITAPLILDTGAAYTTITLKLAQTVGYVDLEGFRRTRVRTAIGSEHGYVLATARFAVLGLAAEDFPVHVFDLGSDISGLIGMNFLNQLNYEIRSTERRILVEPVARATA